MNKEKIRKEFIDYVLENGSHPQSVYAFCKKLKIKEGDLYEDFSSFAQLESEIWKTMFREALAEAEAEDIYPTYSAREKMLAVLYTWIEVLKKNRSYILKGYESLDKPIYMKRNVELTDFKFAFYDFANEILLEARENQELENRPIPQLMKKYPDIFWAKTLYILDFWVNDISKSFEKTDTMIEKSVNTVFDLLARSPIDSLLDLGKFIFQNRK